MVKYHCILERWDTILWRFIKEKGSVRKGPYKLWKNAKESGYDPQGFI
jgi:hypothetical protein